MGRERPVLFGQVMLAGPRDREGVAAREGEAVGADLRVSHVEPDLAREARVPRTTLRPRFGPRSPPTAWRRHGRTRRARASILPTSCSRAAASTGRLASWPSARSTRCATAIEWRRSALFICCQRSRSFGRSCARAHAVSSCAGPAGHSDPKKRLLRWPNPTRDSALDKASATADVPTNRSPERRSS